MVQVKRYFFMPMYEFLCQGCGKEMIYKIVDKYPTGVDIITCPHCKKVIL